MKNKIFLKEKIALFLQSTRLKNNENEALRIVGEILFWACSTIDNHPNRIQLEQNEYVKAIKYIRNRFSHNFIEAIKITYKGATFPMTFPIVFFEIKWKNLDEIGRDEHKINKKKECSYEKCLADTPVRVILGKLEEIL